MSTEKAKVGNPHFLEDTGWKVREAFYQGMARACLNMAWNELHEL